MFIDILTVMKINEAEGFFSVQESFKPLESYFCVLLVNLERNMISNYINKVLLLFPNKY